MKRKITDLQRRIDERVENAALLIIHNKYTIRKCASIMNCSKSTIHKDMKDRLLKRNGVLYNQVKEIIDKNLSERHIRGGQATKLKYKGGNTNDINICCENGGSK